MEFLNNFLNKNSFSPEFSHKAVVLVPEDFLIRNLGKVVSAKSVFSIFFRLRLIINLLISFIIIYYYYSFFSFFILWRLNHED